MKLHYFALIFIFSLTHFSQAQTRLKGTYDSQSKKFKVEGKNYEITHFRHGLSYYYVGDLYGVIDTTGLIICEPQYYEIEGSLGGLSRVTMNTETGK